jgi:hypothetical protein
LWLRIDRGDDVGFFDNMARHAVISEPWADAEISGTVDADATRITLGVLRLGVGTTWYDAIELSVQRADGAWQPVEVQDGSFEAPDPLSAWHIGTGRASGPHSLDGWQVTVDHSRPAAGAASLRIQPATRLVTEELFAEVPAPGETVDVDLGRGLRARVPIVARQTQAATATVSPVGFDAVGGTADVIVFWNVFQHFWPYWNVVPGTWSDALDGALADALDDRSVDDHVMTLERLGAAAPDGHVSTVCPGQTLRAYPPFAVDLVENQVVVTASADQAVQRGDVIVSIDGRAAAQLLAAEEALVSGSPQWRQVSALLRLGRAAIGSTLALRLRRGGAELQVEVKSLEHRVPEPPALPAIARLDDGVYYVDLARASMAEIDSTMEHLANARGVVFDVRGRPNDNHDVMSHLLTRLDESYASEAIPLVIRPDHPSAPASWEEASRWNMPIVRVAAPHISGRVAFLTGPGAISYTESVMTMVDYYHLGEIVGAATAGTNGDIAQIGAPTGCNTLFTGRRVTKLDGSRLHLIGIQPTIPASRTIAGVIAARDDILEKALTYVRGTR